MYTNGMTFKKKTHVDIPLEIALPHFISDDNVSDEAPAFGNFKLSLQSFVCHEGHSVDAGHYKSFARIPDPEERGNDKWLRFDDLENERVIEVSIEESLRQESPYLLFYQVMPIDEAPTAPNEQVFYDEAPPSYAESNASHISHRIVSSTESSTLVSQSEESRKPFRSTDTSISEEERKGRSTTGFDSRNQSQRGSVDHSATVSAAPSIEIARTKSDGSINIGRPKVEAGQIAEEPPTTPPSRRGSNISKTSNKSRPTSSSADHRLNVGLSRLTKRISGDRLRHMASAAPSTDELTALPQLPEEKETFSERMKFKHRHGTKEHHLLGRSKKPERECILM